MNFIDNNLNKKRYTIVDDVNNGVIINDNFTQFEWIKTEEDFKAWQEITHNTLFGTYQNDTILKVIDNFNPKQGNKLEEYKKAIYNVFRR